MSTVKEFLFYLLQNRWKYEVRDASGNQSGSCMVVRWISPQFGEHYEYWIELELKGKTVDRASDINLEFLWLNWNVGGGRNFIHIPDRRLYQTWQNLDKLCSALGLAYNPRSETQTLDAMSKCYSIFKTYYELS